MTSTQDPIILLQQEVETLRSILEKHLKEDKPKIEKLDNIWVPEWIWYEAWKSELNKVIDKINEIILHQKL